MTSLREELPFRRCVGVAVFNQDGKVWAGRRIQDSETPLSHRWQLPQGGIDKGEDPFEAAKRELFEIMLKKTGMHYFDAAGLDDEFFETMSVNSGAEIVSGAPKKS